MPPYKALKTYEKKSRSERCKSKSEDAINALFAQNISKRMIGRKRKPKIKIMELPPRTENYLDDSSLTFNLGDTFDNILEGKVYNNVKTTKHPVNYNNSSSGDNSKSKFKLPEVSISFHSPIITRKRLKQNNLIISSDESTTTFSIKDKSSTSDNFVTSDLLIEKEKRKLDLSSLSYIQVPKVTNKVRPDQMTSKSGPHNTSMKVDQPSERIFTNTFKEQHTLHSSTPCVVAPIKKIIEDSISPICRASSSKLIEKSYDEIRRWDSNFPILENGSTPKGPVLRSSVNPRSIAIKNGRRKSTSSKIGMYHDWKLNVEPKVHVKSCDIIDYKQVDQKLNVQPKVLLKCDCVTDFKGFTDDEKYKSARNIENFLLLKNLILQSDRNIVNTPLFCVNEESSTSKKKSVSKNVRKLRSSLHFTHLKKGCRRNNTACLRVSHQSSEASMNEIEFSNITKEQELLNSLDTNKSAQIRSAVTNVKGCFITVRGQKICSNKLQKINNNTKDFVNESTELINLTDDCRNTSMNLSVPNIQEESSSHLYDHDYSHRQDGRHEKRSLSVSLQDFDNFESIPMPCSHSLQNDSNNQFKHNNPTEYDFKEIKIRGHKSIISISDDDSLFKSGINKSYVTVQSQVNTELSVQNSKDYLVHYSMENLTHKQEQCLPTVNKTKHCEAKVAEPGIQITSLEEDFKNKSYTLFKKLTPLKGTSDVTHSTPFLRSSTSLNFLIPSTSSNKLRQRSSNSKIIIHSNISLGVNHNNNVDHDHSYSILPSSDFEQFQQTTWNNCVTNETDQSVLTSSDIIESSVLLTVNDAEVNVTEFKKSCPITDESSVVSIVNDTEDNVTEFKKPCAIKDESSVLSTVNDIEDSVTEFKKPCSVTDSSVLTELKKPKSITLRGGKTYRRSLSMLKSSSVFDDVLSSTECSDDCLCIKCLFRGKLKRGTRRFSQIVPASVVKESTNNSILENYAEKCSGYVQEEQEKFIDASLDDSLRNLSLISGSRNSLILHCDSSPAVAAKDIVLRRCGQTEILPFAECYPNSVLQNCQKIGEGVYGEVFLFRNQNGGTTVMKVIPIEGDLRVNGEKQKKFGEILSEILISMELSNLRNNKKNFTRCFTEVQKVRCTRGSYPDKLLDLWELYDETRGSENESPQMFPPHQLYIVIELANGGQDLESFVFSNAQQVYAAFKQTACALAVAESQLKFEHRDLHWGNVLISSVDKAKKLHFRLNGHNIEVDTCGVEVSIIDFTLSRIEFDGVVIFNDLSHDVELFVAKGDYQFEIYRLMQESNRNEWQHFEPYSNILWLHYLLDKAVTSALRYKNNRTKIHKEYLGKLRKYKEQILSFPSVEEFVNKIFV